MKLGVIGNGFVGKATNILKNEHIEIISYDKNPDLCVPHGITINDMLNCDLVFISVPTPMNKDGSIFLGIIDEVVNELNRLNYDGFIVIRSTVIPGTCDERNVYFKWY